MSAKIEGPAPEGYLWLPEAAARLRVKPKTLYQWRTRRKGPASFRYAGRVVYRIDAIDAYMAECEAADSHSNPALNPLNRAPEARISMPKPRSGRAAA